MQTTEIARRNCEQRGRVLGMDTAGGGLQTVTAEVRKMVEGETDYRAEARMMEQLADFFDEIPGIVVPERVFDRMRAAEAEGDRALPGQGCVPVRMTSRS